MDFQLVCVRCPVCGSDNTRSKVHDGRKWWYVCDNQLEVDHGLYEMPDGRQYRWGSERWYFDEEGNCSTNHGTFKISHQSWTPE